MAKGRRTAALYPKSPAKEARQSTSASSEASSSEPDVEVWDDPEWRPALDALEGWSDGKFTGKPDPKPLAQLLRSRPIPEAVAVRLGVLLDPEWGDKGPKLTMSIPPRWSGYGDLQRIKRMLEAKRDIEKELQRGGKLEAAIEEVKTKANRSRSYLMKAWTSEFQDNVEIMSRYNPQSFLSPREPGES